jgi:hypothetical protein
MIPSGRQSCLQSRINKKTLGLEVIKNSKIKKKRGGVGR